MLKPLLLAAAFAALSTVSASAQEMPSVPLPGMEPEVPEDLEPREEIRTLAQRDAKLDELFKDLRQAGGDTEEALIVEEIQALWMYSGSASIDLLMQRGMDGMQRGDAELARTMFDHVTDLQPDYAEGWARSAELAFVQSDYDTALYDATMALKLEPRHIQTLALMGSLLERMEAGEQALAVYDEILDLYPGFDMIEERANRLRNSIDGPAM